jgi:hypothetical protein
MQVLVAHAAIARERKKYSHGKPPEFPPILAGPRSRAAPGRPSCKRPAQDRVSAGWPTTGRLDDEHDSTPRNWAHGVKKAKSDRVSWPLSLVLSALVHVKAKMGPTLTRG